MRTKKEKILEIPRKQTRKEGVEDLEEKEDLQSWRRGWEIKNLISSETI